MKLQILFQCQYFQHFLSLPFFLSPKQQNPGTNISIPPRKIDRRDTNLISIVSSSSCLGPTLHHPFRICSSLSLQRTRPSIFISPVSSKVPSCLVPFLSKWCKKEWRLSSTLSCEKESPAATCKCWDLGSTHQDLEWQLHFPVRRITVVRASFSEPERLFTSLSIARRLSAFPGGKSDTIARKRSSSDQPKLGEHCFPPGKKRQPPHWNLALIENSSHHQSGWGASLWRTWTALFTSWGDYCCIMIRWQYNPLCRMNPSGSLVLIGTLSFLK